MGKDKINVVVDFEVMSNVDLRKHGRIRHAKDPSTRILMAGYKYDLPGSKSRMWFPGDPLPDFTVRPSDFNIVAHNAEFEYAIFNYVGVRNNGFTQSNMEDYTCTMALCGRYGLPLSLDAAAKVLGLEHQKNPEGWHLIKLFCMPSAHNFGRDAHGNIREQFRDRWKRFVIYCHDDVESEFELFKTLPASQLSPTERAAWLHSCDVNARGIPVDIESVKMIKRVAEAYREAHFDLLPDMTDGRITKITQAKRIVDYVNEELEATQKIRKLYASCKSEKEIELMRQALKDDGKLMPNCRADTVARMLEREDLPDKVAMILEMRAALGLSSIGKYVRFEDMEYEGRCYDNQLYYGAHTGRWAGRGVQLLNLPRAYIDDIPAREKFKDRLITEAEYEAAKDVAVEQEINRYFDGSIVDDNPVKSARALIRPMVKAPAGKLIAAADYSSIEYVILEWFAGDEEKLDRFANGKDQYVDQAAAMYNVNEEHVTPAQRQAGKVVILACGYGQGAKKLVSTASTQWGMDITFEEADYMVKGYRSVHAPVVNMWYRLKDAAIAAIQHPGSTFKTHKVNFRVVKDRVGTRWLAMTLPSGRAMYYNNPFLDEDKFGLIPCHWGYHQTSKSWLRMKLIPGRITENVVQATARDILVYGMKMIEKHVGPIIIWSIYDEVVCEISDETPDYTLAKICDCLCLKEDWAKGIPLRAEGFYGPRYKKM